MPDHILAAYQAYEAMPWERSLRKLAPTLGLHPSKLLRWSTTYGWVKRTQKHDLATRGAVFPGHREWRRRMKKIAKWGEDQRFWLRPERHRALDRLNHQKAALGGKFPSYDWDSRLFQVARNTNMRWRFRTYGIEEEWERLGKPRGRKPQYLGSA